MEDSISRRALGACCFLVVLALAAMGTGRAEAATLSFGSATPFAAGTSPLSVTSGDFDRDGDLDLATANIGEAVSVLLNRTSSAAVQARTARSPTASIVSARARS